MSPPEIALWQYLRTRPGGLKFRRQHRIDPYKLDFFCREAAVAIEVDGCAHNMGDRPARDELRDALLAGQGILTLRFLASDVPRNLEAVAVRIEDICASRTPPPPSGRSPSPRNRGEDQGRPLALPQSPL
jgi:very-short-patch-repair endonuclease